GAGATELDRVEAGIDGARVARTGRVVRGQDADVRLGRAAERVGLFRSVVREAVTGRREAAVAGPRDVGAERRLDVEPRAVALVVALEGAARARGGLDDDGEAVRRVRERAAGDELAGVAVARRVVHRGRTCLHDRAALVTDHRAGVRRRVGRFLHGAPRDVQLPRVDGEANGHDEGEERDGDEHDGLATLVLVP